jgi:hypothetical protein
MVAGYLLVQLKYRLRSGIDHRAVGLSHDARRFAFRADAGELPPGLKTYWLPIHVTLAFLGNAAFA